MAFSSYTTKSSTEIEREFGTSLERGLTGAVAEARLHKNGPNVLAAKRVTWWHILRRQFVSPFIYLLVAASVLAFVLGEVIDGAMILLFVLINASLGFYQEFRSEQTIRLLQKFTTHRARVIRDGEEEVIESTHVVLGDLIVLSPGDIVPCDLRLVVSEHLTIDETILTGESVPVTKQAETLTRETGQIFEALNMCFSGTVIVSGEGKAVAVATGPASVIGGIAKLTGETEHVSTFEKGISRFSRFILRMILVTLVGVVIANIAIKGQGASIPDLIIFSIALAVSVIPEALPVVATFSLSRGALHLAKNKVVVKRLSAIEDLGSIEILCTDKTGTLTENILTVADVLPSQGAPILRLAALASRRDTGPHEQINSFDEAIAKALDDPGKSAVQRSIVRHEIPFDPSTRRNVMIIELDGQWQVISRGAPEEILKRSRHLAPEELTSVHRWITAQGRRGRRVIAVASRAIAAGVDPADAEKDLTFAGIIAFEDPLKPTTIEAITRAKSLGVRVKILTGDSAEVAGAVGHQIGLTAAPNDVMTGAALDALDAEDQRAAVEAHAVFARVSPEQKYRIIQLLQEQHEVGFLGEGINDAPALKIANVALVVNDAADIAREAADIVLLKKSLKVIVDGIEEGRQVFANTMKYIKATLASNFGNFYAVAIASLLIDFLPMLPVQILLVNLLSDFPMIAIATDTVDRDELRTPRQYDIREVAVLATLLGIVSTVFDFIFFGLYYRVSPEVLQTNWFIGSIITELALLFSIRTKMFFAKSRRPSRILIWLSASAFLITMFLPFVPLFRNVFHFVRPSVGHLVTIVIIALCYFVATEVVKLLYARYERQKNQPAV